MDSLETSDKLERNLRKTRTGIVSSAARNKTITVKVERRVQHLMYGKSLKVTKKFHAHDETNIANVGDTVLIMETRPLSKLKRWRLLEVLVKAK